MHELPRRRFSFAAFRNGVRGTAGTVLALLGIALLYTSLEGAGALKASAPRLSPTTTMAPPVSPPASRSRFPELPAIAGRSAAELAGDPAVRGALAPFTAPGVMNFVPWHRWLVRTDEAAALSYRWGSAAGELDRLEGFLAVATSRENDRPRWPTPENEVERAAVRRLFALYQRLAPIWDELG